MSSFQGLGRATRDYNYKYHDGLPEQEFAGRNTNIQNAGA
jgi:hypothetical protein